MTGPYERPGSSPGSPQGGPWAAPTYQPAQPTYPGEPAYAAQWPGYPTAGPEWPPPRRPMPVWAWVLIAVAVIAAFVLAVTMLAGDPNSANDAAGTDGRTLSAPAQVGDYATVPSIDPHRLADQLRGQLASVGSPDLIDHAAIGAYGRDGQLRILFIGFELSDAPQLKSQVANHGVRAAMDAFSAGITGGVGRSGGSVKSDVRSVPPGPLGGFMKCGTADISGQRMGICAWGDRSAIAMTLVLNPADNAETARLTQQVRAAAEH